MRAIVIDDEPWMLRHFSNESAGLDEIELVGSFRNPLTALEYVQSNSVELVFVDIEMPQLNGAETAKRLRELLPGVRIVIVSAYDESHIETMLEGIVYGYLRKPYRKEDLQAVMNKIAAS